MDLLKSPVPEIYISLAPPEELPAEPYSPFSGSWISNDEDGFRPQHLTPPPTGSPRLSQQFSPLRPARAPVAGKGLERERFEALLQASRERNAVHGAKKAVDLRKEITLKAHRSKQTERRALFLSKMNAPPSPSATTLPKTPPESPAIFHYTLPSPGLVSPLEMFESLANDELSPSVLCSPWIEQVVFRVSKDGSKEPLSPRITIVDPPNRMAAKPLPSLDEITARLSSQRPVQPEAVAARPSLQRLPAFLMQEPLLYRLKPKASLPIGVGKPQLPSRSAPSQPQPPSVPKVQVTPSVVPRASSNSPAELPEKKSNALTPSQTRAPRMDMLNALKRRTIHERVSDEERRGRRASAPADLENCVRFKHAVLSMPGGF